MMARKRSKGLSERQKKILDVLEWHQNQTGYPPSIREICTKAEISSTSVVNYYLDQLEEMGFIERDGRVSRGIRLVKPLSEVNGTAASVGTAVKGAAQSVRQAVEEVLRIPMLGRIVAGQPAPVPP
jgi:repressor LexA